MTTITPPPGLAELVARPNWVGFKREARPGDPKPTKIPYQVAQDERGRDVKAKAGDPTTWGIWTALAAALAAGRFDGPGYEFHAGEGLVGIDIDNCRDPETGALTPLARAVVCLADTYAEPSISGTGLHIIGKGELPRPLIAADRQGKNKDGREMYGGAHFFTMTFAPFPQYDTLRPIDAETMRRLFLLLWPDEAAPKPAPTAPREPVAPLALDDAALLDKAFAAKGGDELYRQHHGAYLDEDKSADDFAYIGRLRFWTQGDAGRMRQIALTSGRVRDKWHTRRGGGDWLEYTITKSLDGVYEIYNPTAPKGAPSNDGGNADPELVATLRADVARLGDELRAERAEKERLARELAELREERDFYRRCLDCPDPVIGRAAPAIAEELHRSYRAGAAHVKGGQEFARLNFEGAAEGKPINRGAIATAAERLARGTPRDVIEATYNRDGRDVKTNHHYFACPVEERASVARLGLGLLARAAPQQRHQGRKPPKVMPPAVAAQDAPVRREQIHVEKFFSLRDDTPQATPLAIQTTIVDADYWTAAGEQLTQEAARDWQVAHGVRATTVETQHHPGAAIRRFVGEGPPTATTVEFQQKTPNVNSVETQQYDLPIDPPGQCLAPDCGDQVRIGGYCEPHYDQYSRRYTGAYDYAAGDD